MSFGIREILQQRKENKALSAGYNVVNVDFRRDRQGYDPRRMPFDRRIAKEIAIQCESQTRVEKIREEMRAAGLLP